MPFFPRVLVGLIGLDHAVVEWVAIQPPPGVLLEAMPQVQQVPAVAAQFAGQLCRRDALGDPAKDQDDLRWLALGPLEDGAGPGIEDAAAMAALIVEHRGAVAAMDAESIGRATTGAGQAVGVQHRDEFGVAGIVVHQVGEGEIHSDNSPVAESNHQDRTGIERDCQEASTNLAS
jgi:hypothetical protein